MALISSSTDTGFYTGLTTNQIPLNPETSIFMLKSLLKTAGWTIAACGTGTGGTATSGTTDLLSSSVIMTSIRSWFCVRRPSATQSFTFQHDATANNSTTWRIKYSPGGFATTASQTNNTTPGPVTGSEEIILVGGGTDNSPTFAAAFAGNTPLYRTNIIADNLAPHGWWFAQWPIGGGSVASNAMVFDPMLSGSYDVLDVDPYIHYFRTTSPFQAAGLCSPINGPFGYFRRGLTGATGSIFMAQRFIQGGSAPVVVIPGALPTNIYTGQDEVFLIPYARSILQGVWSGWKGFGTMMKWVGQVHNCGDTLNISTTRDHIVAGQCALSWSGETGAA